MGKRINYDKALSIVALKKVDSIYAPQNKYGYHINVNHPQIKPLYDKYKWHIGENILSDAQRMHFESLVYKMIEKNRTKETENANDNT